MLAAFRYIWGAVLSEYIAAAMRRAHYELMEDDEGFFGTIPSFEGVWGQAATLEECREELQSTLEGWLLLSLSRQMEIPVVEGIDLAVRDVA
jgi:predicted RNase H-like HicB family nuclease